MEGVTFPFIVPYALLFGASTFFVSLFSSIPLLVASVIQLLAIPVQEWKISKKKLIIRSVFVQAILWLVLLAIPYLFVQNLRLIGLLIVYSVIVSITYFIAPLWRTLIGQSLDAHERGSFFSKRERWSAFAQLGSTLFAGMVLYLAHAQLLFGFAVLFCVAFLARIGSAYFLGSLETSLVTKPVTSFLRMKFLSFHKPKKQEVSFLRRFKKSLRTDAGRFISFLFFLRVSIMLANPFFVVYQLQYLGFGYGAFTLLLSFEILASILMLPLLGKLIDNDGSNYVLWTSALLLPLIPLLYLFGTSFVYFLFVSFFSGLVMTSFNLASSMYLFDVSESNDRTRTAAFYQLFHGFGTFLGAASAAALLVILPFGITGLLILFTISSFARGIVLFFLLSQIREMRLVEISRVKRTTSFPYLPLVLAGSFLFSTPLRIKTRQRFVDDPYDVFLVYGKASRNFRPSRVRIEEEHLFRQLVAGEEARIANKLGNYSLENTPRGKL